jgi:hypothetical protein
VRLGIPEHEVYRKPGRFWIDPSFLKLEKFESQPRDRLGHPRGSDLLCRGWIRSLSMCRIWFRRYANRRYFGRFIRWEFVSTPNIGQKIGGELSNLEIKELLDSSLWNSNRICDKWMGLPNWQVRTWCQPICTRPISKPPQWYPKIMRITSTRVDRGTSICIITPSLVVREL